MQAEQYVKYPAFFRRLDNEGNYVGRIAHDTTNVDQMQEQHLGKHASALEAQWTLRQAVTFWAHSLRLSRLPEPLPFTDQKPDGESVLEIEVPYTPQRDG